MIRLQTRVRQPGIAERVQKLEKKLNLTNLFDTSTAPGATGAAATANGVGGGLVLEDELPAVRTRQVPSSQGSQKTLETENKSGVRTAMLAASAQNLSASQALSPVQLLREKNLTGQ